jgi:hypothetical protein
LPIERANPGEAAPKGAETPRDRRRQRQSGNSAAAIDAFFMVAMVVVIHGTQLELE